MSVTRILHAASYNNAAWCDAVCRAWGGDTKFGNALWLNRGKSPPYYSNAVTLNPDDTDAQLSGIRALLDADLPDTWSVKDSFCSLDLSPLGFRVLFEARWFAFAPDQPLPMLETCAAQWERITNEDGLAEWEIAWRRHPANEGALPLARIFVPALVTDPNLAFLTGRVDAGAVAVAAANCSDNGGGPVCGISNLFLPSRDGEIHRIGALGLARATFPGMPLVGYGRGHDLAAMRTLGFEVLGPLRVWIRQPWRPAM